MNSKIRREAAFELGRLKDRRAEEALMRALNDKEIDVRRAAEESLKELEVSIKRKEILKQASMMRLSLKETQRMYLLLHKIEISEQELIKMIKMGLKNTDPMVRKYSETTLKNFVILCPPPCRDFPLASVRKKSQIRIWPPSFRKPMDFSMDGLSFTY